MVTMIFVGTDCKSVLSGTTGTGSSGTSSSSGSTGTTGGGGGQFYYEDFELFIECITNGGDWYVDSNGEAGCIADPRHFRMAINPEVNPNELDEEISIPCSPTYHVITLTPYTNCEKHFLQRTTTNKNWLAAHKNTEIYQQIMDYINGNGNNCSTEREDFMNECISQMIQNPGVFNSITPFLIEKQIDDSQLDPCSKGVFQQIKNTTNCDFANVLTKLGAGKNYNTTMISAVPPSNRPGQTIRNSAYNYTVYISTDYSDKTKLFIATTELHELVHAYFMSLFDDYNNGNPSNPNAYNDFAILFQMYVNKTYPGSGAVAHHQQMATDYVNAIASALKEFQPGLDQQIYDDLAWGSLQEAPIFDTLFPVGSSNRERIINRYTSESIGAPYGQGTPNEQTPVGQPCN